MSETASASRYASYNTKYFSYSTNTWGFTTIKNVIDDGRPIVFRTGYYDALGIRTGGHYVVCNSYSQLSSNYVRIIDPLVGYTQQVLFSSLQSGSYANGKYDGTIWYV